MKWKSTDILPGNLTDMLIPSGKPSMPSGAAMLDSFKSIVFFLSFFSFLWFSLYFVKERTFLANWKIKHGQNWFANYDIIKANWFSEVTRSWMKNWIFPSNMMMIRCSYETFRILTAESQNMLFYSPVLNLTGVKVTHRNLLYYKLARWLAVTYLNPYNAESYHILQSAFFGSGMSLKSDKLICHLQSVSWQ